MSEGVTDMGRALAIAVLASAIVLGSAFLWIGIPIGAFWLAGELTTTATGYLFFALGGVPPAMVGFGWVLYRINAVYVRTLQGGDELKHQRSAWLVSSSDTRRRQAPRTLIDVSMTVSAVAALVILFDWFFFFAQMDLAPMQ